MISDVGIWPSGLVRLFLPPPKKSPPFLAPQKSQKSRWGRTGLDRRLNLHLAFST